MKTTKLNEFLCAKNPKFLSKITLTILTIFILLITVSSAFALVSKTKITRDRIDDGIIVADVLATADILNINVIDIKVYESIVNSNTTIGFTVKNDNVDVATGIVIRVQPNYGVPEQIFNLPPLNPGQTLVIKTKWIYTTAGIKNANIGVEYNSNYKDYPVVIDCLNQNFFTISGNIYSANTGLGIISDVSFGSYTTVSNGAFSLTAQSMSDYFSVQKNSYYLYVEPMVLKDNINKNIYMVDKTVTDYYQYDFLNYIKDMTGTNNLDLNLILTSTQITDVQSKISKSALQSDVVYKISKKNAWVLKEKILVDLEKQNEEYDVMIDTTENEELIDQLNEDILKNEVLIERLDDAKTTEEILDVKNDLNKLSRFATLPIPVYFNRGTAPVGYEIYLQNALNNWSTMSGHDLFIESSSYTDYGINFEYKDTCDGASGMTYIEEYYLEGDLKKVRICIDDDLGLNSYLIMAHELGHGLSIYGHSVDQHHVMKNPPIADISQDEGKMIRELYNLPALTQMEYYQKGYIQTYIRCAELGLKNITHYRAKAIWYSEETTNMYVCKTLDCANCNNYDRSGCTCYVENILAGTSATSTCYYLKTEPSPTSIYVCNSNNEYCTKMFEPYSCS